MNNLLSSLLVLLLTFNSFAQKVDVINAPLNPMPVHSSVAQHNLKGNVFQLVNYHFTRDGKRFLTERQKKDEDVIEFDGMNRIVKISTNYESITDYAYDDKNRVIKEIYRHPRGNWTKDYTYNQVEDILKITVKQTGGNRPSENEQHFKDGFEIQSQLKGQDARRYQYEFDKSGNWIKKTTYNMTSTTMNYGVETRDIIYYDEYDLGIKAISVVAEKFMGLVAVPKPYINSTKYHPAIDRFKNDFIFYDALTKTYYIARDGHNANHTVGQKITVEKLSSGYETVLVSDGKQSIIIEAGNARKPFNEWKTKNYLSYTIAADSTNNKSFAFGPSPLRSDTKATALGGTNMMDKTNKVSYLFSRKEKALHVFENGKKVPIKYSAIREGDLSIVVGGGNTPMFVIPPVKNRVEDKISPARYFNPKNDKLKITKP